MRRSFFLLIFCIVFLGKIIYAAPDISYLEVKREDGSWVAASEKTNSLDPACRVSVQDSADGLATKQKALVSTSSTLALWHFNEALPTVFDDSSGNNYSLTPALGSVLSTDSGKFLKAVESDSTNYILSNSNLLKDSMADGTIEFWIKPDSDISNPANVEYIVYKGLDAGKTVLTVNFSTLGTLDWKGYVGIGDANLPTNKDSWSADTWYYVALVFDSGSRKIYVDGELDASDSFLGQVIANTNDFMLGGDGTGSNSFQGAIDDVRISTVCLGPEQIFANYNSAGYSYSKDNGATWSDWQELTFGITVPDGSTSVQSLDIASVAFNQSSSSENELKILVSNVLNEYTTTQFSVNIDTIPPNVISSIVLDSTETKVMQPNETHNQVSQKKHV